MSFPGLGIAKGISMRTILGAIIFFLLSLAAHSLENYVFPATVNVTDHHKQNIDAHLMVDSLFDIYFLSLTVGEKLIGTLGLFETADKSQLFIFELANLSISAQGVRGYHGVGRALIDVVKQARQTLGYQSIGLHAYRKTKYHHPTHHDVLQFYQKMGFIPISSTDSSQEKISMIFNGSL